MDSSLRLADALAVLQDRIHGSPATETAMAHTFEHADDLAPGALVASDSATLACRAAHLAALALNASHTKPINKPVIDRRGDDQPLRFLALLACLLFRAATAQLAYVLGRDASLLLQTLEDVVSNNGARTLVALCRTH